MGHSITDDILREMSREERGELSRRLAQLNSELPSLTEGNRRRSRFIAVITIASAALIPWVVTLALTLPRHYVAGHWTLTWVGFDVLLLGSLSATAWLAWRRRQLVVMAALITGTLLTCDAWFDITTANGRTDVILAALSGALLELPLAGLLFAVAYHLLALTVRGMRAIQGSPTARLLTVPLFGVTEPGRTNAPAD